MGRFSSVSDSVHPDAGRLVMPRPWCRSRSFRGQTQGQAQCAAVRVTEADQTPTNGLEFGAVRQSGVRSIAMLSGLIRRLGGEARLAKKK
jgi:hypothetical protein